MAPGVSVIIPFFNRENFLARAVSSVLKQTFRDFELILVDDGSTDNPNPEALIANASVTCKIIRLKANQGVSAARNAGVLESEGKLIAFLDSDDKWDVDKLSHQLAWWEMHSEYRICQTREIWVRRGVRVNPPGTHLKKGGWIFPESLERCMITPSSVMMERSLFDEMDGFNESLPACEDYDLWLRISSRYPVGLVEEYLLTRYGGHADQLSSSVPMLDRFRIRALLDLLQAGITNEKYQKLAAQTLALRAGIVAGGYKKRNKLAEYEQYEEIAGRFRGI